MRRLLALLSAAALVASLAVSPAFATKGTPGQSDQTDHLACTGAAVATLATCSQFADGMSTVILTGDPTGNKTGQSLYVTVAGATIISAGGDFLLAGGVVTDADPIDLVSPADFIIVRAPSSPGTAVVSVYEISSAVGIATLEGTLTIGFQLAGNELPIGTHDGSTIAAADGEYCYANGWTIDPDQPTARLAIRILADGSEVWTGSADEFRPDVRDAGYGDGYSGFWVSLVGLITPDEPHEIVVEAQDAGTAEWAGLNLTPRTITCLSENHLPTGTHEAVAGATNAACVAAGWAADQDNWAQVLVRISSDDEPIAYVVADEFRQDLLDAGIGDGRHGFRVEIGSLISSDVPHVIRVEALDANSLQWTAIDWTPLTITCTEIFGTHEGSQGVVPKAECRATGWAADLDTPTGPRVQVRIKVDGRVVAETTADQYREDVRLAGFGDGYSGFEVDLFGKLTPNRAHLVTAEARDTSAKRIWVPLDWTPLELTCTSR